MYYNVFSSKIMKKPFFDIHSKCYLVILVCFALDKCVLCNIAIITNNVIEFDNFGFYKTGHIHLGSKWYFFN